MTKRHLTRLGLLLALTAAAIAAFAGTALGAVSLQVESSSTTTVAPGGQLTYSLLIRNTGATDALNDVNVTITAELPEGLTGVSSEFSTEFGFTCSVVSGASVITCTGTPEVRAHGPYRRVGTLTVAAAPGAAGVLTAAFDASFEVEPGGASETARTVDPVLVTTAPPAFGVDAFDQAASKDGLPFTVAAAHPDAQSTAIDFDTFIDPSPVVGEVPVEDPRDVAVDLPAGFFGNPAAASQCTLTELSNETGSKPLCPEASQVGIAEVRFAGGTFWGSVALYNMIPPPGAPARFAFSAGGIVITLDAHSRTSGDYGLTAGGVNIPQALPLGGQTIDFWGVPSGESHDAERSCPGELDPISNGGTPCKSPAPPAAFFRNPTSCEGPSALRSSVRLDSWQHSGDFLEESIPAHSAPGSPYPQGPGATFPSGYSGPETWGADHGTEACGEVPFEPTLDTALTTERADSPTGLTVDLGLPADCWDAKASEAEALESLCQSDMRDARVTLPQGMSINPSAAGGRAACTPAQIGLITPVGSSPVHFDEAPVTCPDASKIGTVEIETPLLGKHDSQGNPVSDVEGNPVPDPLTGSVYLAQQGNNPFNSMLAMYLVAEGSGVVVKQAGEIELGPSGQITTTFHDAPQTPFSKIHVELFGGQRAALRTPAACGTYTTTGQLTPWSGNAPADVSSSFGITQGCGGGFDPHLFAGTQNPLAGSYSPFHLRLTREDGTQELAGLRLAVPEGLLANLKGIPYCSDATLNAISRELGTGNAQITSPSCPAASQLGTVTAGAGAGANPFYSQTGKAYWAGPYKGAPVSLAAVVPAVAGPFDLGSVVVRNGFEVNPETARITAVSDPFPTILHGIPLDLRDVRVDLDRPNYTLNPTSCEPLSFEADITSAQGAHAQRSQHFQAAACDRLGFKPKLSLKLKGGTKRGDNPALTAVMRPRVGDANAARIRVALPHSEFLDQSHIRTICTRVQFAADACPKGSIYGYASAYSPILDYYLRGPVILRSSSNQLPDLVLALRGSASQPIEVDAVGRIDSVNGGIRTTFAQVPDAPLSKVVLRMAGGKKSLLQNSTDICAGTHRATVEMDAHNGKAFDSAPALKADCGGRKAKRRG